MTSLDASLDVVRAVVGQVLGRGTVRPDDDFFALGGQSLQAVEVALELRRRTGVPVDLDVLFTHRRPADLAALLAVAAPPERRADVSPAQERLLVGERLHPGSARYCVPVRYRFHGDLDAEALHEAWQAAVDRHEALRTYFPPDGRRAIRPAALLPWSVVDLSGEEPAAAAAERRRLVAEEARRAPAVGVAPLARALLVSEPGDRWTLLLTLHHLVADRHSLDLLDREVQECYGRRTGLARPLPPLPRRGLAGHPPAEESLRYWRERLAGLGGRMPLPADRPRPDLPGPGGDVVRARLDPVAVTRLGELAAAGAASDFLVLLAACAAFLGRVVDDAAGTSAAREVVVGTPFGGRTAADQETVGMFVNVLPIRVGTAPGTTFRQLLGEVRGQVAAALAHQQTPLQRLVAEHPGAASGDHPLTQVSISHVDDRGWHWAPHGARAVRDVLTTGTAKYELLWTVTTDPDGARSELEFSTDLFTPARAGRLHEELLRCLDRLLAAPDAPVAEVLAATSVVAGTPGGAPGGFVRQPADLPVHEVVARQARARPDAVAVREEDRDLTYGALDAAATRLAHVLARHGVRPGDRVAVAAGRGVDAVTAFLAVLRAGAAYVPVDVAQPAARSRTVVRDSGCRVALAADGEQGHVPDGVQVVGIGAAPTGVPGPLPAVTVRYPAYVMYTSGSTGTPKGVVVPHEAIRRLVPASNYVRLHPEDIVAHLSNLAFDAATFEIWGALCAGATLMVVPRDVVLSPHRMGRFLHRTGVTVMFTTNALLNAVVAHAPEAFAGLRVLLVGGDQYAVGPLRRMLDAGAPQHLVNAYGPTENTTFSAAHEATREDLDRGVVPIGGPVDGTYLRVLDDRLRPAPAGAEGELYVGGRGLADGYVGDARRTSAAFVADPLSPHPGRRVYRTGDLVRLDPGGLVVFLGRRDDQVKVSGFRVEIGEVEAALRGCPGVLDGAVVPVPRPHGTELVAVTVGDAAPDDVRAHLRSRLPAYMLPAGYRGADRLPLTPNGKVDRAALRAVLAADAPAGTCDTGVPDTDVPGTGVPDPGVPDTGGADGAPGPVAAGLAGIWRDLLGGGDPGPDSSFYGLGGTSIKALHLVGAVHERFGADLRIVTILRGITFAQLVREVTDLLAAELPPAHATEGAG